LGELVFWVVEAMNSGTPVIASNRGAILEVIGDGGLLVDRGILSKQSRLLEPSLQRELRMRLTIKGPERPRPSPGRRLRTTVRVYQEVLREQLGREGS
jgi:glycosyltransferase involved in cell wall biosynthesis